MERNGNTGGDDSKFEEMMQEAGLGDGFTPQDTCAEILRRLSASSF